ncbi:SAC3 family protein B isoform X1 [Phoenix dactylifera]|uniref:SAC3 family protein B isoform X1 n=1 Tax=Phoenix dactylifera TaxID=42345 RepID=A0A8B7CAC0_PHODC|nr:SAC3 family protein B isoform X1 [Phoenix dactylifera]
MAYEGFGKNSGPAGAPRSVPLFGNPTSFPSPPNPTPFDKKTQPVTSQQLNRQQQMPGKQQTPPQSERLASRSPYGVNEPKQSHNLGYPANSEKLSPVGAYAAAYHVEAKFPTPKRARSPPLPSHDADVLEHYNPTDADNRRLQTHAKMRFENGNSETSKRIRSPPLAFESNRSVQKPDFSHEDVQRPDVSPPRLGSQRKSPVNYDKFPPQQSNHQAVSYSDAHDTGTLSPPKPSFLNATKRARSPVPSADVLATSSTQSDSEREMQAKAKRLARFNVELSQPIQNLHDFVKRKPSGNKDNQASLDKCSADEHTELARDLSSTDNLFDTEGPESSQVVVGLCPDMCPESERKERERKGDLDRHERLDGERNQTTKFLSVKKYNRTAEREADLIRPMPVLQKTVDYLLSLLDQPYSDNFLSIYNFLWDRMRAIRMDLRMQHIFNQQAIIMLEQMIRLHIIAMHELCEYKKGEGFSEGFDAHLNIEQMNKTSVELFQMYDDHRKKGISVPTEKEFRGYYALLKLDKHPGYKVEPAELSLDLAKMTPKIRCAPEILFARDAARACRIGNYIAFFRLARKATYLQACLMHAHFAKIRTQALASLHSGLQNNQGIPIAHVVDWLGIGEEDVEGLLQYHGFVSKKYEGMYMVKEGPFLNGDVDFPTKCAKLVHLKKSKRIVDDVYSGPTTSDLSEETEVVSDVPDSILQRTESSKTEDWINTGNEEVHDYKSDYDLRAVARTEQLLEGPLPATAIKENDAKMTEVFPPVASYSTEDDSLNNEDEQMTELDGGTSMGQGILPQMEITIVQAAVPGFSNSKLIVENTAPQTEVGRSLENEASKIIVCQKNEVASEKLKLIIRKWKRIASSKREIREQRMFLANAALSSLSFGPPVRQIEAPPRHASCKLNIDYIARERYGRHEKSWSTLNISELVAPILSAKNPNARCLCWKLLVCVQENVTTGQTNLLASRWLLSKLMGSGEENDELMVLSSHLSIWKKWINRNSSSEACCLSVIREAMFVHKQQVSEDDTFAGASCIIFLVSESIPWEIQRVRLQNLLTSVPSGSSLPLLIVVGDAYKEETADPSATVIKRLGLHDADKTRVNLFSVVFLVDSPQEHFNGFFNDDKLREGLQWLANCSPVQPSPRLVKTRELVLSYLRSSLRVLDNCNASEMGPDCCILAFNKALDRLVEEILIAASINPIHWPCPEVDLLEKSSRERMIADMFLPSIDWSSPARTEPLTRAIKSCKLPNFSYDLSFLRQGSHMGLQIPNQKLAFEDCLIKYLTQSCQLLSRDLAAKEASVMVQKGAGLELHDSCYFIIPRWVTIFRRIYNWRLVNLTSGEASVAYVLDPSITDSLCKTDAEMPMKSNTGMQYFESRFSSEGQQPLHYVPNEVPFDEIFEINCSDSFVEQPSSVPVPVCSPPGVTLEDGCASESAVERGKTDGDFRGSNFAGDYSLSGDRSKQRVAASLSINNKKLTMLLEQCKNLQDMIDEKLTIYF